MMRLNPHILKPGEQTIEVLDKDRRLLACIYQTPRGLKIVSKHINMANEDLVEYDTSFPPAILINLLADPDADPS